MSTEKSIRVDLRVSENDKSMLKKMAYTWDCSESYVIRRAIKAMFEKEFQEKER